MRYGTLVGCVLLGASVAACGGMRAETPLIEEPPVAVSAGAGGAEDLDTGEWAPRVDLQKVRQEQREFYEEVADALDLREELARWEGQARPGEAVGGGGGAGGARQSCAEVLAANEPAAVISGTLELVYDGVMTLNVPGEGAVKLHVDERTCAVQAGREQPPASLLEGTEARASYVMKDGLPTARVVRAAPVRPLR